MPNPLHSLKKERNRRLAAIMFTDMVGYTALMQRDEEEALRKRQRHREVFQQEHQRFKGEIIQYFGDGTLSLFADARDAVVCAAAMQRALRAPIEVPLRIGIHAGSVIVEEDGIVGDAVNIASRIESFANVGGVLVSDTVRDQVGNQSDWDFVPLGQFQLKNVERPFDIYALAAEGLAVPAPDLLQGKGRRLTTLHHELPTPAAPILGRDKEIGELLELLADQRVVTITGAGGMGKTRLALAVADRLRSEFPEGIAFISLAALTEPADVLPTIAAALDVKDAQGREPIDGIATLLADKQILLILDNLEQVMDAGRDLAELPARCPNLTLLCTSRTPLKIRAEQEYALHPLALPPGEETDEPLHYPAVDLFVRRAQQVNMDFELTADNAAAVLAICRRVDGLPLALELAAARIRILPPERLLQRLGSALDVLTTGARDLPERHQTLRATIDWSYSLLNEAERRLFRRLGVFADGFSLEAVEKVGYADEAAALSALDELESLVDKGLVESVDGGRRFRLLQTIKDFALEELRAAGETQTACRQHAAYCLGLARLISEGMQGRWQLEHIRLGVMEMANMQAALDFLSKRAIEGDEAAVEMGLQLCGELSMFWHIRGKDLSLKNTVQFFLDKSDLQQPSLGQCKAVSTLAGISWAVGDFEQGEKHTLRYYDLARELNDRPELVKAATFRSFIHLFADVALAEHYSKEAVALAQEIRSDYWLTWTLWGNGLVQLTKGELGKAREKFEHAYALIKSFGENELRGTVLSSLARLAIQEGDLDAAIDLFRQSLATFEAVGVRPEEARIQYELAWVYLHKRHIMAARRCFLDSIQAYREIGSLRGVGLAVLGLAAVEAVAERAEPAVLLAAAAEHFAEQEGLVNVLYDDQEQAKAYIDAAKAELLEVEIANAEREGARLSVREVVQMVEEEVVLVEMTPKPGFGKKSYL